MPWSYERHAEGLRPHGQIGEDEPATLLAGGQVLRQLTAAQGVRPGAQVIMLELIDQLQRREVIGIDGGREEPIGIPPSLRIRSHTGWMPRSHRGAPNNVWVCSRSGIATATSTPSSRWVCRCQAICCCWSRLQNSVSVTPSGRWRVQPYNSRQATAARRGRTECPIRDTCSEFLPGFIGERAELNDCIDPMLCEATDGRQETPAARATRSPAPPQLDWR
jgi:hypothetical protein